MNKTGIAIALLAAILATSNQMPAQKPAPRAVPATSAPDRSQLDIEKSSATVAGGKHSGEHEETSPLKVVAQFCNCGGSGKRTGTIALGQLDRVLAAEREVKKEQVTLLVRIKNQLTPEQQGKLAELRSKPANK